MKSRRIIILALCLCAARELPAQTPEQLFRQANLLYQQTKYAEARDMYENIVTSGYASGELYYNLGNAYYKSGSVPKAILNYERALRLLPGDDDLRHNLQLANMVITDRIEPTPHLFIWDYWDDVKDWLSMKGATLMMYLWFVVVAALAAFFLLARTYTLRKIVLGAGTCALVVFLFFLVVFIAKLGDLNRTDLAIVMEQIVTVKNSPDVKSSDAFVLHGGVRVQVIDRFSTWCKVRLADGKIGWMESSAAETI